MGLLDGWFPNTMFGATGSPEAMESDKSVSDLLMRLQLAQAGPSANDGVSLPFAGIMPAETVAPTPAAAQKKPQFAPSIEPSTLESGSAPMEMPTTKVGSRLPSEALTAMEAGRTTTIPKSPAVRGGNMAAPAPSAPDFSPSLGERISNFGDALTGRAYTNFDDQGRTRQTTYGALLEMGMTPKMAEAAVRQPELLKAIIASKFGTKGRTQYGLRPEWGERTLPDGSKEWVMMQPGDDATVAESKLPPGVSPVPPGDIAGVKKYGSKIGEAAAEAEAMLDSVKSTVDNAFSTINKLRTHEGLDAATGTSGWLDPRNYIRGTSAYDFDIMNTRAQAQSFMAAREGLKGAGQVTDFEGTKGEQAISNLSRAQTKKQYLDALDTLETMMRKSYEDLQKKAALGNFSVGGRSPQRQQPGEPPSRPKNVPRNARWSAKHQKWFSQDPNGNWIEW